MNAIAKGATVRPVPRSRQSLGDDQRRRLVKAAERRDAAEVAYRAEVLTVLDETSFTAVAEMTGLSTNTLQRWKREATAED